MFSIRPIVIGVLCIALAFPMYFAEGGIHPNTVCNPTPANPKQAPPNLDCISGAGCPPFLYYYADTGTCGGTSEANCFENPEFAWQRYNIASNHVGWLPPELAATLGAGAICFAAGTATTGVAMGLVIAVVCAGVTYALIGAVDPCLFYSCSINWTAGSTSGPYVTKCN
ncbi:hypothetical protein FACS1894189_1490 [Planctomycetales bacterium]|nr:hypothetical protein FACS1894189_1490 [Planctomycetales bacterium]